MTKYNITNSNPKFNIIWLQSDLPLLMVSRCSHRISPAVQSDVKLWKSSRSRPHSSLPCKPLRSEPRQWSPNSAWHQSSQWFTSHSDHRVGSEHKYKPVNLQLWRYHIFISSTPLIKAPSTELFCGWFDLYPVESDGWFSPGWIQRNWPSLPGWGPPCWSAWEEARPGCPALGKEIKYQHIWWLFPFFVP